MRSSAALHWPTRFSRGCYCYNLLTPYALKLQIGARVCIYMMLHWDSSRRFGFRILHRRLYDITQPTLYHQSYVSASLQCVEKRYCDFIFLPSMERVAFVTLYKALLFTCDTCCLRVILLLYMIMIPLESSTKHLWFTDFGEVRPSSQERDIFMRNTLVFLFLMSLTPLLLIFALYVCYLRIFIVFWVKTVSWWNKNTCLRLNCTWWDKNDLGASRTRNAAAELVISVKFMSIYCRLKKWSWIVFFVIMYILQLYIFSWI